MIIRREALEDSGAIFAVNAAAFETSSEADLVEALREHARPTVSLVAQLDGRVVGHILFSPVIAEANHSLRIMGLGPMAVTPEHQGEGIGSALVRAGLDACRALGACAVVVLGHPRYYPRFGCQPASRFGIHCEYDVPDEAFMALELKADSLRGLSGRVSYHEAFDLATERTRELLMGAGIGPELKDFACDHSSPSFAKLLDPYLLIMCTCVLINSVT